MSEPIYVFRTLLVPDQYVALARQLTETLAGAAGSGMFSVPLSPTGDSPATHWESTGLVGAEFAGLLPLVEWRQSEDGVWGKIVWSNGEPETIVYLAAEAGLTVALAEVEALLAAADVTEQEWPVARGRLGLVAVQPDTPSEP